MLAFFDTPNFHKPVVRIILPIPEARTNTDSQDISGLAEYFSDSLVSKKENAHEPPD